MLVIKFWTPSQPILLSDLNTNLEVPTIPSSGSDSIEWLAGFRKTLYLCIPVHYKGYNSETAQWKKYIEQSVGVGVYRASITSLGILTSCRWVHQLQALSHSGFYGGFIVQVRLIKSLAIDDWTQPPAPLPFGGLEVGLKVLSL